MSQSTVPLTCSHFHFHSLRLSVLFLFCVRHKVPPRSLLELVDPQVSPRVSVLQRANSISMFQAVRSWNLTSSTNTAANNRTTATATGVLLGPSTSCTYLRAKLASGVPLLMATVGPQWTLARRRIRWQRRNEQEQSLLLEEEEDGAGEGQQQQQQQQRRRPRSKLQKWKRMVFGR
jgi:hypothetical protein